MIKIFTAIFILSLIACSCGNPKTTDNKKTDTLPDNGKADIIKISDALKKYETPSQFFKVPANKPAVVTGRQGTKISINPDDLETQSGKPLAQNIELELKELSRQEQLLSSNAQTVSDGRLLISGGAYFIGMTSDGETLRLKQGKTLSVQFPKLSDKDMTLFYGQRNDLGQMNWQRAADSFKTTQKPPIQKPDTGRSLSMMDFSKKSEIDKIIDYVDTNYNPTPEEKEKYLKQRKNYIVSLKVYDAIGINKLGWINCDRFWELTDITDLYVSINPMDSVKAVNVYLVFKDINSVIQACYYSDKSPQFSNMPVGYKATLIAYTVKDEKVFAYSTDLVISKGQKLNIVLSETSEKDFKALIRN